MFVTQLALSCEPGWVRSIANTSALHIGKYCVEPAQVEAALFRDVLHPMATRCGQHRFPLSMEFSDLHQQRVLVATVINRVLRLSLANYIAAEHTLQFTLGMKWARLLIAIVTSVAAGAVTGWMSRSSR